MIRPIVTTHRKEKLAFTGCQLGAKHCARCRLPYVRFTTQLGSVGALTWQMREVGRSEAAYTEVSGGART